MTWQVKDKTVEYPGRVRGEAGPKSMHAALELSIYVPDLKTRKQGRSKANEQRIAQAPLAIINEEPMQAPK